MTPDLEAFKIFMMVGKGLTPAQQAWPPLTLEGYAQLETKRAQRRCLGSMESLCWTDHANWTKQQTAADVDVKHLRWVSEIISDGSEIRSLSGRSAKLADGPSRNPKDRDAIVEQRTRDLGGMTGQLRGFDVEQFLYELGDDSWNPVPWTMPSDSIPDAALASKAKRINSSRHVAADDVSLAAIMASSGVKPKMKILYVSDYVEPRSRLLKTQKSFQDISRMLPAWEVELALSEGPFSDDEGVCAHFDKGRAKLTPQKLLLETKNDLLTSCGPASQEHSDPQARCCPWRRTRRNNRPRSEPVSAGRSSPAGAECPAV